MVYLYAAGVLCLLGLVFSVLLLCAERWLADYGTPGVRVNDKEAFTVQGGLTLLDALYGARIFIPSACGGKGTCGFCKVSIPEGGGPVLPTEEPFLSPGEIADDVRLACQVKVKRDLEVLVRPEFLEVQEYRAVVASVKRLTPDTKEIRLRLTGPAEIDFRPGQYIQVTVPGTTEFRAYSISSSPDERDEIELIVRLIPGGLGSTYLHWVEPGRAGNAPPAEAPMARRLVVDPTAPGDEVRFTGPYGDFELSEDPETELVFVGGGCGMAPIKSIIHYVYERWPERESRFFYGARAAEDAMYLGDFQAFAREYPGLEICYALSEPKPTDDWDGPTGFIHESVDEQLEPGTNRQAFLCGPPPMVEATIRVLRSKGVPQDNIFSDKF